ncbi:TadE/TadG family type IV pilus assembly protein [Kordiimonas aestuarii]|uniref:TadE/TadG family type IV pilus assembly protein n=1 Tax=Kordiimonas aestuarii TaxID=1005925 RepID=UPI0021D036FB|nr:TadE/TadG family type IV pilus assembly protein [Kordiimonas aestuarii]
MSLIEKLRSSTLLARLRRDQGGAILTELALSVPIFLTLLTGVTEVGNYMLMNLKLQHTVVSIADLVTRDETISEDVIDDIFKAVPQILNPFPTGDKSLTIVSSISQTEDVVASVFWQRSGGGSLDADSALGAEGDPVNLPAGLTLRDNETILATEVYYRYEPLVFDFIPTKTIRKVSYFRPRIGALQEIEP